MAYTNKLDVNVITFTVPPPVPPSTVPVVSYHSTPGTIDQDTIIAYYQHTDPVTGVGTNYCTAHLTGNIFIILDITYAALDALINP